MSTSSGVSDSEDSSRETYEPIHRLAMVQLQPPRNPSKPLTSFSIRDILGPSPAPQRTRGACPGGTTPGGKIVRPWDTGRDLRASSDNTSEEEEDEEEINVEDDDDHPSPPAKSVSPLDALMAMTSKTFEGLETPEMADAKKREQAALFGKHQPPKKRRKSRTAFTNQQIYELEKRFLYQKYLTPADRDEIAQSLGLSNAQVITWFQNRRAKLKRDLEELKNDVTAAKKHPVHRTLVDQAAELEALSKNRAVAAAAAAAASEAPGKNGVATTNGATSRDSVTSSRDSMTSPNGLGSPTSSVCSEVSVRSGHSKDGAEPMEEDDGQQGVASDGKEGESVSGKT